jgi:hypothetical protein
VSNFLTRFWTGSSASRTPRNLRISPRDALLPFHSTKPTGSGLGLTLCREIIEAHGGRLSLANRSGGGALVTVWSAVSCEPPRSVYPGRFDFHKANTGTHLTGAMEQTPSMRGPTFEQSRPAAGVSGAHELCGKPCVNAGRPDPAS